MAQSHGRGPAACVIVPQDRQLNLSRTCLVMNHCRGMTSRVRSVCSLSSMRDVQVRHDATPHSALISGGVSCKNAISTEKETKLGKDCLADAFCWRGGGYNRTRRITGMQPPHAEKFTRYPNDRSCLWHLRHRTIEANWIFSQPLTPNLRRLRQRDQCREQAVSRQHS